MQNTIMKTILGLPWQSSGLTLCTSNARGVSSIPGRGTKISHAAQSSQKNKNFFSLLLCHSYFPILSLDVAF